MQTWVSYVSNINWICVKYEHWSLTMIMSSRVFSTFSLAWFSRLDIWLWEWREKSTSKWSADTNMWCSTHIKPPLSVIHRSHNALILRRLCHHEWILRGRYGNVHVQKGDVVTDFTKATIHKWGDMEIAKKTSEQQGNSNEVTERLLGSKKTYLVRTAHILVHPLASLSPSEDKPRLPNSHIM